MLTDMKVTHFTGHGISVTFSPHSSALPGAEHKELEPEPDFIKVEEPQTQWHHKALWGPQGAPPTFPVKGK